MYKQPTFTDIFVTFAGKYDSSKHRTELFFRTRNLMFKLLAVDKFRELIVLQEHTLWKKYNIESDKEHDYNDDAIQIAYLDAYLSAVYSLTENIAEITALFYPKYNLPHGFNSLMKSVTNKRKDELPELCALFSKQDWYSQFHKVRSESTHFGTAFLVWNPRYGGDSGRSNLCINNHRNGDEDYYIFDFCDIHKIYDGLTSFIEDWSNILLKKIDGKASLSAAVLDDEGNLVSEKTVTLKHVLNGKDKVVLKNLVNSRGLFS